MAAIDRGLDSLSFLSDAMRDACASSAASP
jgi:hypothetical protein